MMDIPTSEPLTVYSLGRPFSAIVLDGLSLSQWIIRMEHQMARLQQRAERPIPLATLQADIIASAVFAMQNTNDIDNNEGELAHQVHGALQSTYKLWIEQPPDSPYFKSRLLETNPEVGLSFCRPFHMLEREQLQTINQLVECFLLVHKDAMNT